MKIIPMKPDAERVADQPIHGAADYRTCFDVPCKLTFGTRRKPPLFRASG